MVMSNDSGNESGHDIMAQWSSFTTKKGSVHSKINHAFTNKQSLVGALNQWWRHDVSSTSIHSGFRRLGSCPTWSGKRVWTPSACFQLKFKRLVLEGKRLVLKPGFWLAWRGGGRNKLTLRRKVCFWGKNKGFETLVSGSGNKGLG